MRKLCPECGAAFTCSPEGHCWCAELPRLLPVPDAASEGCLCPGCLPKRIESVSPAPQTPESKAANK